MSEFIAFAEIAIIPNTKGFRTALKAELETATAKPVSVKVTPDTRSFAKQLRAELRTMKLPTVGVLVRPDMKGFKAALQTAVNNAAKGVTVPVGTRPVAGAARAAAAPRGPAPLLSKSGRPLSGAAAEAKAEANARIAENAKIEEARRKASIKAHAENLKRIKAEEVAALAAIEKERAARAAAAQAQIKAGLVSKTGQPLFGAAAEAKAAALEREKAELATTAKIEKAETAAWARNVTLDKKRAKLDEAARLKVLADLEAQGLLSRTGRPLTGAAREAKLEANARVAANAQALTEMRADEVRAHKQDLRETARLASAQRALRVNAFKGGLGVGDDPSRIAARAQAEKVLANAKRATGIIDDAAIGSTTRLEAARAKEAAAQALAISTTKARRAAEEAGLTTTAKAILAEEELALARLATAQADLKSAAGEETLSKRRSFFTRAVGAQSAAFAGLRGAVLAANPAFIAGTVAAVAFGKAIQSAAQFESELSVFRVTAGATALEMEKVAAAAQRLGRDVTLPGVAATDAAETMTSLAKAGLSVEDSLAGARGVLQLATAAAISNAEATELAASALNAFGLAGTDAVKVADVFANSANAAQGSISDVGIALQQAAAVARQVGVSFEDTVALLTLLARNGIRGSDAGTSLRVAFTRLVAPTAQAAAVLDELNVKVRDAQGNLRPEVFADIATAMQGMTRAQQDANAKIIFGVDALRAYSIVSREGISSLNQTRETLDQQGTAADLAAARMAGLTGAAENLKNQLAALGLTLGQTVVPALTGFVNTVSSLLGILNLATGGIAGFARDIKDLGEEIKDIASVEIAGFTISPLSPIVEPLDRLKDASNFLQNQFKKSVFESRVEVFALLKNFNEVGDIIELHDTILQLKEVQTSLQGGGKEAEKFAADIGALIKQLQDESSAEGVDLGELHIDIPPEILRGEAGTIAAEAARKAFLEGLDKPLTFDLDPQFNLAERFKQQGVDAFTDVGQAWRQAMAKQMVLLAQEIRDATGRINVLADQALQIEIEGGPNRLKRLLRNAQAAEPELRANVERALDRRKVGQVTSPEVRAARAALKENLDEQERIRGEMQDEVDDAARDAEDAADKIRKSRDKADQALLDSFAPAERRVERRATIAEGTPGLQDDIAAARARKQQLLRQIAVIRSSFNDRKAAADEIAARRQEILEIEQKIANETKASRDAITETLGKRIELAQLQGGRGAILKAIDNAIKDAKNRVKNWKRLGLVLLDEQIELAKLVKSRKDFLNDLTGGESPDVFVDRLFREAVDQFRRFGSNISTGSGSGIISPQGARGQFASILTGNGKNVTNLTETTAQRTRETALAEEKKQTAYLRIIAGGPRTKFVKGAPIPPEATKIARDIADNVLSGL